MTEGLSASDVLALTRNDEGGMAGAWNNPFIYLVWLALLGGDNGLFGNRGASTTNAVDQASLHAAITDGNANQDMFRNFGELNANVNSFNREAATAWGNIRYDMMGGFNGISNALADNRFAQQSCCLVSGQPNQ